MINIDVKRYKKLLIRRQSEQYKKSSAKRWSSNLSLKARINNGDREDSLKNQTDEIKTIHVRKAIQTVCETITISVLPGLIQRTFNFNILQDISIFWRRKEKKATMNRLKNSFKKKGDYLCLGFMFCVPALSNLTHSLTTVRSYRGHSDAFFLLLRNTSVDKGK